MEYPHEISMRLDPGRVLHLGKKVPTRLGLSRKKTSAGPGEHPKKMVKLTILILTMVIYTYGNYGNIYLW